ncbi:hypothetical protein Bca101_070971 [Brassica carinata]
MEGALLGCGCFPLSNTNLVRTVTIHPRRWTPPERFLNLIPPAYISRRHLAAFTRRRGGRKKVSHSIRFLGRGSSGRGFFRCRTSSSMVRGRTPRVPMLALSAEAASAGDNDLQWAVGKTEEDRVQLAVFEKQGWFFAGIYDRFNGPDASEFLMADLSVLFIARFQSQIAINPSGSRRSGLSCQTKAMEGSSEPAKLWFSATMSNYQSQS